MNWFLRAPSLWVATLFLIALAPAHGALFGRGDSGAKGEYLIVSGGPSLSKWEDLREDPHDRWWGNFVRAARFRMTQLIRENTEVGITWLVYRPAYVSRGSEDGVSRIDNIRSVPEMFARDFKHPIRLIWFDRSEELISYINQRRGGKKIIGFEYFGHSNRHAFMFDYSNQISGVSCSWLHERDLRKIRRRVFGRRAYCKSWGCYSGLSFCPVFRKSTGISMWGATHKTDFSELKYDRLPKVDEKGKWVYP